MKRIFYFMALAASVAAFALSCTEPESSQDDPNKEPEVQVPEIEEVTLSANPLGAELTCNIETEEAWLIYSDEDIEWIAVDPEEGLGETEVTFTVDANTTGKDRSATYYVKAGEYDIYEIFISQVKQELPIVEGDYNFLKEIVDRQLLGDSTPEITDWYAFDGSGFPGITCEQDGSGKFFIKQIDGAGMTGWPSETVLTGCVNINLRNQTGLSGCELSEVWNTPKLQNICLAATGMTGVIPAQFAESSVELAQIFFDSCDFYGALPHIWGSKKLEVVIIGNNSNHGYAKNEDGSYKLDDAGNKIPNHQPPYVHSSGLGYMIPATLDVIFNQDRTYQGDLTQIKIGGVCEGNFIGFEKGWGQARYERYDENAVPGDTATWSDYRLLVGKATGDVDQYDRDLGQWAYYFSNLGYMGEQYSVCVPKVLLDWNQADADAYTAKCKAERGL